MRNLFFFLAFVLSLFLTACVPDSSGEAVVTGAETASTGGDLSRAACRLWALAEDGSYVTMHGDFDYGLGLLSTTGKGEPGPHMEILNLEFSNWFDDCAPTEVKSFTLGITFSDILGSGWQPQDVRLVDTTTGRSIPAVLSLDAPGHLLATFPSADVKIPAGGNRFFKVTANVIGSSAIAGDSITTTVLPGIDVYDGFKHYLLADNGESSTIAVMPVLSAAFSVGHTSGGVYSAAAGDALDLGALHLMSESEEALTARFVQVQTYVDVDGDGVYTAFGESGVRASDIVTSCSLKNAYSPHNIIAGPVSPDTTGMLVFSDEFTVSGERGVLASVICDTVSSLPADSVYGVAVNLDYSSENVFAVVPGETDYVIETESVINGSESGYKLDPLVAARLTNK